MKTSARAALLGLALFGAGSAFSQTTATTDPVGFVSVTVPANSDAVLAVPLNRTAVFKGVIQSISGTTITVAGTSPAWTTSPQQFVYNGTTQLNTYAVQLATGAKEGMTAKITANTANTVTVQLASGDTLGSVKTEDVEGPGLGDHIDIMPYWTPASLITTTVPQGSEILLLEAAIGGVNLASSGQFGYDSGSWADENTFDSADNAPLEFGHSIIFRNNSASPFSISMVGAVPMSKHRVLLRTYANNKDQDLAVGFSSPVPTAIGSIGLNFTEDDQLLVFNNSAAGKNKSASQVLFYTNADGWVDDSFQPVGTTFFLQPGQGYVFRKKSTGAPTTFVWTALQSYLQ